MEQALLVDACQYEVALVEGFGALGAGAYAHGGEGVAYGGEEAALFGQGAGVANYGEGVHLEAVVVVESKRFVLYHARVELEACCLQALAAARVAAVEYGHIVTLRHSVDGIEERQEVLFGVDVFLAVG